MELLPTELLEIVTTYLVPHPTREETEIPASTIENRNDVYNARQTCRALYHASTKAFATIIGDVPFYCSRKSMSNLRQLVQNPDLARKITRLTIDGFNPTPEEIEYVRAQADTMLWAKGHMIEELTSVFESTIMLRGVRCVPMMTNQSFVPGPDLHSFVSLAMLDSEGNCWAKLYDLLESPLIVRIS
jgi:hypothetical protein